jgi:hypothetical protein
MRGCSPSFEGTLMEADEKACPRCAETIKAKATGCRFCGHEMGAPVAARPLLAAKPRKRWRLIAGIIVGVFLLINLGMCVGRVPTAPVGSSGNVGGAPPVLDTPISVTAMELWRAYGRNEAAAQEKYGDHALLVDGAIQSIDLDVFDNPKVLLHTGNPFQAAQAALGDNSKPKAAGLKKGQKIRLLCTGVSEVIGTPMLKDCEIQ